MLIDFHTHAFPERIAQRAVISLAHGSGGMVPQTDGTLASLKQKEKNFWKNAAKLLNSTQANRRAGS